MKRCPFFALLFVTAFIALACSGGHSPIVPGQPGLSSGQGQTASGSKAMWGVWRVEIDTNTWEVTAIPERGTQYTVDVVTFLQKPAGNPANLAILVKDVT
jgi:hypothetical protein